MYWYVKLPININRRAKIFRDMINIWGLLEAVSYEEISQEILGLEGSKIS